MLKGLSPVLGPDLLFALRSMGHGDELAIVDGNYPADTDGKNLVRADGLGLIPVLEAVLSVMPLDVGSQSPVMRTCNYESPDVPDEIHQEIDKRIQAHYPDLTVPTDNGAQIYDRVKRCHTIVATSEHALYANIVLRKGVVSQL